MTWVFKLPEHLAWTALSLLIPALMIRVATIDIPSEKSSLIGRFNERYVKYINGYENWRQENYYYHTVDVCTAAKLRKTKNTWFESHCWSPRNVFKLGIDDLVMFKRITTCFLVEKSPFWTKYHSRLLSIVLTSLLAIYVEVLVLVMIYKPYIHILTQQIIEGWKSVAPAIILVDQFLSTQGQENLFDAEKISWYIGVFQTYIGVIPTCFNLAIIIAGKVLD